MLLRIAVALALWPALALAAGCDRNVEPFDPQEKIEAPDLSKIFPPAAAQRAAREAQAAPAARDGAVPPSPPAPPAAPPAAASDAQPIRGTVRLAPELEGRVPAGAVLFLIARVGDAGPPSAVKRFAEPRFPLEFEIGPEDRMIANTAFEGPFRLTARVDADRNAMTRTPGDLGGSAATAVEPGARDADILIDEIL